MLTQKDKGRRSSSVSLGWEAPWLIPCACLYGAFVFHLPQTREALLKILDDMKEDDYLNFILFSTGVTTWKDHLVKATPANLEEARMFVKNIRDQSSELGGKGQMRILPGPLSCTRSPSPPCLFLGVDLRLEDETPGCLFCSLGKPVLSAS